MAEGARLLNVSRKQLEDIETTRDYGCHLDIEVLAKARAVYSCSVDDLLGKLPSDAGSVFYERQRKRGPQPEDV